MSSKTEFEMELLSTDRVGINELLSHLDKNGFYDAPCSSGNHLAKHGGLVEHSLNVLDVANDLCRSLHPNIEQDSLVLVCLLHDLGKMGQYGKPNYIENYIKDGRPTKAEPEQKYKQSKDKPYKTNSDLLYVDHEIRSIQIASQFIELTEEESFAILYHNGMYGNLKYSLSGKETELYMILHWADMWTSRIIERDIEVVG